MQKNNYHLLEIEVQKLQDELKNINMKKPLQQQIKVSTIEIEAHYDNQVEIDTLKVQIDEL